MNRNITFVKVNGPEDTSKIREFGISGYPTVVLLNTDGKEIDRIVGYEPPAEFLNSIDLYMKGSETLEDYRRRVKNSPDSIYLLYNLAEKYEGRSEFDSAGKYYAQVIEKDPNDKEGFTANAMRSSGSIAYRSHNFEEAIEWEEKIINKLPGSDLSEDAHLYIPYYYEQWANYAAKNGDIRQAKSLKGKAIKLYEEFLLKYPDSEEISWTKEQIKDLKENKQY